MRLAAGDGGRNKTGAGRIPWVTPQPRIQMKRSRTFQLALLLTAAACSRGARDGTQRLSAALSAADSAVFVGDRTQLTATFDGDEATIDGIGPVESGVPVQTPPLSRETTFTLRVSRGADHAEASATVQAHYRNLFRVLHDAPVAQKSHLAAALPDGRAILMGGNTSESLHTPDSTRTQIFDPASDTFTAGPDLLFSAEAQEFTTVIQLANGAFLLVGGGVNAGFGARTSVVTQLFDPAGAGLTAVGDATSRGLFGRTATALGDGGALLTGGFTALISNGVERYDPSERKWRAAGQMVQVRTGHTATLLRDGRVLIAGGMSCCQTGGSQPLLASTAELYDPATDAFTGTGSMKEARTLHAAALLQDGRVLIAGGEGEDPGAPPLGTEIFDPASGQFTSAGDLLAGRDSHAAVTLTDGRVLVVGGEVPPQLAGTAGIPIPATEIFDPSTGRWSEGPMINRAFFAATVTLLGNGKVLVFGGEDITGFPRANAAVFE